MHDKVLALYSEPLDKCIQLLPRWIVQRKAIDFEHDRQLRLYTRIENGIYNRESYENSESLGDVIRTALSWIKTHWSRVTEVAHCEENDFLR